MRLATFVLVFLLIAFFMLGSILSEETDQEFKSTLENFTWSDLDEIQCSTNTSLYGSRINETLTVVPCGKLHFTEKTEKALIRFTNAIGYTVTEGGKFIIFEARESELNSGRHHNYNLMVTLIQIGIWLFIIRYLIPVALFVIFLIKWIYETAKPYIDKYRGRHD